MSPNHGFAPIGEILPGALKGISSRAELRLRLEAEQGHPISDEAFRNIPERDGAKL